jgi:hypothetical protein
MTAFAAIASKPGAFADMDKAAIDIAKALVRLSRDLLTRGISYKLQERAYGGLSTATTRKLERAAAEPRRGQTHVADLAEAGHAARAGVARGHPHGPHPCRRYRVARSATTPSSAPSTNTIASRAKR